MGLIEDAKAAKEAGLSYGQYKSGEVRVEVRRVARIPGKRCVVCGALLSGNQSKYCSAACSKKWNQKKFQNGGKFV